jgi:hypothetical protein
MFTDSKRTEAFDGIRRQDQAIFDHILIPDLFFQAARMCGLRIVSSPLNLVNLVWLSISAARNPEKCFEDILDLSRKTLQDDESFAGSPLAKLLGATGSPGDSTSRHDPRKAAGEPVTEEAYSKARKRMPSVFWVALFILLGQRFLTLYPKVVRWRRFRLMAADGTEISLPDWTALRSHFGTPRNASGSHGPQARLVLLQYPLARLPRAYALEPRAVGENTIARSLLQGLSKEDLVLLDAGFLCYGLLRQIDKDAFFCLRLKKRLNMRQIKQLRKETGDRDVLVEWTPKDSRGQWRKEGLPRSMELRLLTYHAKGFRPLQLLTNVLSAKEVPYQEWWGLSVSEEGEVLWKGAYNLRWEIETTYLELKVVQGLQGGLRSRTPEGIYYEVAGHVLLYLLVRWLMVEAAQKAGVSPLRLSFTAALKEINGQWDSAVTASRNWLEKTLRPRLLERVGKYRVVERPGRTAPRGVKARRAAKRALDAKRAKAAKSRRKKKPRLRPWFGQGWNLTGPLPPPGQG